MFKMKANSVVVGEEYLPRNDSCVALSAVPT